MKVLIAALAFTCAVPIHAALSRADETEIRGTMHLYVTAWLARDNAAVMALLTHDSVLIPNEKPAYVGADAIRNYWFPAGQAPVVLTRFETTIDQLSGSRDMAFVRGTQVIEWTASGERWRTRGNYLTVLRKVAGAWRIAVQVAGNSPAERGKM